VADSTLRAVAAEAGVALGTVHYAFPSKEQLLRAVLEDVVEEIAAAIREAAGEAPDMESAMLASTRTLWTTLVEPQPKQQLMQYELSLWALRANGMAELARWQYERYLELLAANWAEVAARAGIDCAVPVDQLARLQLAGADGLLLQYLVTRDSERAVADLEGLELFTSRLSVPARSGRRTEFRRGCLRDAVRPGPVWSAVLPHGARRLSVACGSVSSGGVSR
jgi:AcrR family transcriptional regulator